MKTYNWATYGTGVIANQLAQAMASQGRKLYSVSNRTYAKGVAFAEKYNISKIYDNPEDVFTDENVDIIYISTPHNTHLPLLLKALANGKHVLCEKSITLNSDELAQAIATAESGHAILAEAVTIYHMPLYKKLHEIAVSGELGPLRMIQMNFGSYKEYDMANRFFNRNLAGGAMLDIGVYALSFAPLVHVISAGSDPVAGKACSYRCRRTGNHSSQQPGAGNGNHHPVSSRQTAEARTGYI